MFDLDRNSRELKVGNEYISMQIDPQRKSLNIKTNLSPSIDPKFKFIPTERVWEKKEKWTSMNMKYGQVLFFSDLMEVNYVISDKCTLELVIKYPFILWHHLYILW